MNLRKGMEPQFRSPLRHLSWPNRVALGAALAVVAICITFVLELPDSGSRFLLAYPAVVAAALLAGRLSGYVSTGLATFAFIWRLAATWTSDADRYEHLASVLMFCVVGIATSAVLSTLKRAQMVAEAANLELCAARDDARAAQEQTDLLLRELRHRVKNDISNAVSLLRLQARRLSASERVHLEAAADRLMVLSRVHERLARQGHSPVVDLATFLQTLCDDLVATMCASRRIEVHTELDPLSVPSTEAVAIGLIVNELLTNAAKYAFGDRGGDVFVRLKTLSDGTTEIRIEDNGCGYDLGVVRNGLGHRLVRSLVAQLSGVSECRSGPSGTEHCVRYQGVDCNRKHSPVESDSALLASATGAEPVR